MIVELRKLFVLIFFNIRVKCRLEKNKNDSMSEDVNLFFFFLDVFCKISVFLKNTYHFLIDIERKDWIRELDSSIISLKTTTI